MRTTSPSIAVLRHPSRRRYVLTAAAALGFLAAATQLALTREIIAVFSGNELTIGTALSCWLLLTALGTWVGTRARQHSDGTARALAAGLIVLTLLAVAEVLLLRTSRVLLFTRGAAVDPIATLLVCAAVLAPFCVGSGALLAIAAQTLLREDDDVAIGHVYGADGWGSVAGAMVFTFALSTQVDHVMANCLVAIPVCGVAAWIGWRRKSRTLLIVGLVTAVGYTGLSAWADLDARSTQWQHRGTVVRRATSPYGRLVVTEEQGQLTFYENGVPALYTANTLQREELVHFALAQRPDAQNVLLIGGGVTGAALEALRYPRIRSVTCLELDPTITTAGRELFPQNVADPRILLVTGDARQFVQRTKTRFDAILVDLPDPTTYQLNRYYTLEFMRAAKRSLVPGGVLGFGCGHYENYVSAELARLLASAHATAAAAFDHVAPLPGGRVYFLCSDGPLRRDIGAALAERQITPVLVTSHYLDAMLTADRLADVDRAAGPPELINRDFHPVLYLFQLRHWLDEFAFPARGFAVALGLLLVIGLVQFRAVPRMIFTAGFSGAALEIVLLITLQTVCGALYQQVGLVVGTFMLGLAAGATVANSRAEHTSLRWAGALGGALAAWALVLAWGLPRIDAVPVWLGQGLILGATLGIATAMGAQFSIATTGVSVSSVQSVARSFSADLLGAALGGLSTATLLLPTLGVTVTCLVTAALNVIAVLLFWPSRRDA